MFGAVSTLLDRLDRWLLPKGATLGDGGGDVPGEWEEPDAHDSIEEVREAAVAGGMETLREVGLRAAAEGRTTIEEVLRETLV